MAAPTLTVPDLTVDDLDGLELPEFWELIEGELIEMSPAGYESSTLGAMLVTLLFRAGYETGLGWVSGADGGFILFPDRRTVVAPDAAFVRKERLPDPRVKRFAGLAPDLAVEVLSPSDRYPAAVRKAGLYLEAGTELVWLVDPERRTVTVFQADEPPITLTGDAELTGAPVLPELRVRLGALFGPQSPA